MQMRRFCNRLDDFKPPAMLKRWYSTPHGCNCRRVDICKNNPRLAGVLGQHLAPRIDDDRMAECFAAVLVEAALGGGNHETAVLNSAGAHQHVPVRLTGLLRERRRNCEEGAARLRERTIKCGE